MGSKRVFEFRLHAALIDFLPRLLHFPSTMDELPHISVAVIAPLDRELTYTVPSALKGHLKIGQRVAVPLGRRKVVGVVMGEGLPPPRLTCKPIDSILEEEPSFSSLQMEFLKWASEYYLIPFGEMLRTALPAAFTKVKKTGAKRQGVKNSGGRDAKSDKKPFQIALTEAQRGIFETILPPSKAEEFAVHLIHGVTGSGKTEVYLACLHDVLTKGKQAISLVPEIALTPQTLERYMEHFGDSVASYHSGLSEGERETLWRRCRQGKVSILIGTRSALFAPFQDLGLIVVDEEQDSSYKQEERARYHARDLAIVRGKMEGIPVVLGSATPSVETYFKAKNGKFFYHVLPDRYGSAQLPKVEVVDLRSKFTLISPRLHEEIETNLKNGEQTLIFLNRRGFSHFLLCEDCGHTPQCPNCDITLTYHQSPRRLLCHYCDHQIPPPELCPTCHGLHFRALGSGTERIEEELQEHFPQARVLRMDRDSTSRKGSHEALLKKLGRREIDILVGTQMIAKGHDYHGITLVGILIADSSLNIPDFRSGELTCQLMTQVAGRSGRGDAPGRVILQTFSPEHRSIAAAASHGIEEFYEEEIKDRQELGYPPFRRLVVLKIQGTQKAKVKKGMEALKKRLESLKKVEKFEMQILGPAPCLVERLKNFIRWQILLKCPPGRSPQPLLKKHVLNTQVEWLPSGLRLIVDVDPVSVV